MKSEMTINQVDTPSREQITPKITFFMIVTGPDLVIADYVVKSYARIKNIDFRLKIYSNWVDLALRQKYFPEWERLDYVDLVKNDWQEDDKKPNDPRLDGPFERHYNVLDRELKKIKTRYFATVDSDFEILDARFVPVMFAQLDADPNLVAISTDYDQKMEGLDTYSQEMICMNERWHPWFCVYRREALQCSVSHAYYEEIMDGPIRRNAWDASGYFQRALKQTCGWQIAVLDIKYQPCFIHYGAFAKNRDINDNNVALYRRLMILKKNGLFGDSNWFASKVDQLLTKRLARYLYRTFFRRVDRSRYWPGWGKK